jgi:hypothetical protein
MEYRVSTGTDNGVSALHVKLKALRNGTLTVTSPGI